MSDYPNFVCIASCDGAPEFDAFKEPLHQHIESCAYPGLDLSKWSRFCYANHQLSNWITGEVKFETDAEYLPDERLCRITAQVVAALHRGDTVVADFLDQHLDWFKNSASIQTFLNDQNSRECVHNITYSQMLDVLTKTPNKLRADPWYQNTMSSFKSLMNKFDLTPPIALYFVMMCEKIMFAPLFYWINALHYYQFTPKICLANILVMRDENAHYEHARLVLATSVANPPPMSQCISILDDFMLATKDFLDKIIDDQVDERYPLLTKQGMLKHLDFVYHKFRLQNGLYYAGQEPPTNVDEPTDFMMSILNNSFMKTNPMESIGINYVPKSLKDVNLDFDLSKYKRKRKISTSKTTEPKLVKWETISDLVSIGSVDVIEKVNNEVEIDDETPYNSGSKYYKWGSNQPNKNWFAYSYCPPEWIEETRNKFPNQTDDTFNYFTPYLGYESIN